MYRRCNATSQRNKRSDRIETVTDQQGKLTRYYYDELGRQKKISYANGTETVYSYNALSRLTGVINRKATGEIISSHKYTLNAAGQRTKIEESGSVVEYGYDKLNRLTSEKRNGIVTLDDGYTYDPVGNRLTKTSLGGNSGYVYDENDRLKSDGKYTYGWDEAGNLTSKSGPEGTTTYTYDAENRLLETNGPTGWARFAYDAQGNRISRTTASGTIAFVVDPNMPYAQVLEESGPAGTKVYAYGNDMLNVQGPEGTRWFAYDGLGSTRALTDGSGTLTDTYTYEAFGTVVHRVGTSPNDFQFTGEQYEAALGMYYLRARYYEPGTGRFGARDAWQGNYNEPITQNKYIYANANPLSYIDPPGLYALLLDTMLANSIRTGIMNGYMDVAFNISGGMLTNEEAEKEFLVGLAFSCAIPLIGAVTKRLIKPAESIIKEGGWLQFHKRFGGHTLERHVDVDDAYLLQRFTSPRITKVSRFYNQEIAENAISRGIRENRNELKSWLRRNSTEPLVFSVRYAEPIGRGFRRNGSQFDEIYDATIVLNKRGKSYFIRTAYPEVP